MSLNKSSLRKKFLIKRKNSKYLESKKRVRAIDSEHAIIQKSNPELLDSFMYPALGYLVLEQAQKGFSGQYGFDRNMKYY